MIWKITFHVFMTTRKTTLVKFLTQFQYDWSWGKKNQNDLCASIPGNLIRCIETAHERKKELKSNTFQKSINQKSDVQNHISSVHDHKKDNISKIWDNLCTRIAFWKKHIMVAHEEKKYFKCWKITASKKRKLLKCDLCSSISSNSIIHIETVHERKK